MSETSPPPPAAATSAAPADTADTSGILPASYWEDRHVDNDADSSLGDDVGSSTASITSSILAYRSLYGRTFHSDRVTDSEYWGPNDEKHQEASDLAHHCLTLIFDGKVTNAPLEKDKVKAALDIGCGTGIWAIDFADEYPDCEVVGTDISPIQPSWVPPNCRFEIEDATKPWTFAENSYDYVHMRYLYGSIPDWDQLFKEAYRVLKPGGWVETMEPSCMIQSDNNSVVPGTAMYEWGKVLEAGGKKSGRTFSVVEDGLQQKGLKAAGFVDLKIKEGTSPLNGYSTDKKWKEVGTWAQVAFDQDIEGYALFMFTQIMGWTPEQTRVYAAAFRKQLRDKNTHPYFNFRLVCARKPE